MNFCIFNGVAEVHIGFYTICAPNLLPYKLSLWANTVRLQVVWIIYQDLPTDNGLLLPI